MVLQFDINICWLMIKEEQLPLSVSSKDDSVLGTFTSLLFVDAQLLV